MRFATDTFMSQGNEKSRPAPIDQRERDLEDLQQKNPELFNKVFDKSSEVAGGHWLTPYRTKWIKHHSGEAPITDKEYLKELQQIILYPHRFGPV